MTGLLMPLCSLIHSNIDYLIMQYGEIVKFFINIAKYIPGCEQDSRYKLLGEFAHFNTEVQKKLKSIPSEDSRRHLDSQKNVLKHYLDQILDTQTLLGSG